ncbi:MAG: SDR family NAD(P)-dependent oxidoreductase [bacterium]|nr:SDR family NAD(P)-dependent oxidoreductase [bacterium]
MEKQSLKNKTALVTGSTSGIGLGIAKRLASTGMHIGLNGLATAEEREAALVAVKEAGAGDVRFFGADLREVGQIEAMIDEVECWGGVDVLVNNAGVQFTTSLADATTEVWDAVIAINLSAAFHTMRLALPKMAKNGYGRVINIASVHGLVASKNKAPYVASKFALTGLSKVAALEYAEIGTRETGGVTINAICPGWTETALIEPQIQARAAERGGDRQAGVATLLAEKQPSLRTSLPEELGELALWLCSPVAHNITGTTIPVDGGWTAQ